MGTACIQKTASGRKLLAFAYDKNGNLTGQEDVAGKVTEYRYNLLDQVTEVWDSGKRLAAYTYNPDGTVRSIKNGNSLYTEYAYDADKNLTMLKSVLGEETIIENHYCYDGNGNRTEKKQKHGITAYTYDRLNQLVEVNYPDRTETLFYDKAGNRTGRVAGGVEERYYYDKRNRLTAQEKNGVHTEYQYDAAGNLVRDDKATYTYDAFNRNTRVETFDGNIQINRYDAEGLRHEMEENGKLVQFIFRGTEVVAEETQEEKIRYIRTHELLASDAESARTYYHYASDEMGSITHVTVGNEILNRYEYDAWGNAEVCEEQVANRFRFNGQQYDPVSQQYYLRARFYNPVIARFTQEDTYRGDGLNLYAYCRNNPVYYVDPSGHFCDPAAQKIMEKLGNNQATRNEQKKLAAYLRNKERRGGITDAERQVLGQVDRKKAAKGSKSSSDVIVEVELSRSRYPESAKHIQDAIAGGKPDVLTIDRAGTKERRKASLKGVDTIPGLDRDEYPPAMSLEGGKGASVRHIGQPDNRGSGSSLSYQLREYPDGTKYRITIIEGDE